MVGTAAQGDKVPTLFFGLECRDLVMPRLVYTPLAQLQEGANRVTGPNTNYALPAINRYVFQSRHRFLYYFLYHFFIDFSKILFLTCYHFPQPSVPVLSQSATEVSHVWISNQLTSHQLTSRGVTCVD